MRMERGSQAHATLFAVLCGGGETMETEQQGAQACAKARARYNGASTVTQSATPVTGGTNQRGSGSAPRQIRAIEHEHRMVVKALESLERATKPKSEHEVKEWHKNL